MTVVTSLGLFSGVRRVNQARVYFIACNIIQDLSHIFGEDQFILYDRPYIRVSEEFFRITTGGHRFRIADGNFFDLPVSQVPDGFHLNL